jgi:hypothetical protein
MGIKVDPSKAVVASVAYVEPEFNASWLEVQVLAACSFPDVLAVDVVTPTDLFKHSFTKSLKDQTSGFAETTIRQFEKASADEVVVFDDTDIDYWIEKNLADLQALADAQVITTSKLVLDNATPTDLAALSSTKALADSIGVPTDAVANVIFKALADSFSLADAAQVFKLYIRSFEDSLDVPDASVLEPQQPKTEIATASDSSLFGVDKNLSEGLNLIDNMDGDIEYAFIKVIGELLVSNDIQVIDFATNKADNVLTGSSGVVVMQDYCDITYFLTDYVGTSRTFT